jgi:hypothetical protein
MALNLMEAGFGDYSCISTAPSRASTTNELQFYLHCLRGGGRAGQRVSDLDTSSLGHCQFTPTRCRDGHRWRFWMCSRAFMNAQCRRFSTFLVLIALATVALRLHWKDCLFTWLDDRRDDLRVCGPQLMNSVFDETSRNPIQVLISFRSDNSLNSLCNGMSEGVFMEVESPVLRPCGGSYMWD